MFYEFVCFHPFYSFFYKNRFFVVQNEYQWKTDKVELIFLNKKIECFFMSWLHYGAQKW